MPNVNTLGHITKEEFGLGAVRQISVLVTLTIDSNVISVIYIIYMNSLLFFTYQRQSVYQIRTSSIRK